MPLSGQTTSCAPHIWNKSLAYLYRCLDIKFPVLTLMAQTVADTAFVHKRVPELHTHDDVDL